MQDRNSTKLLDLIWVVSLGYLAFAETPTTSTFVGALVIFISTTWIARVESRRGRSPSP
jgi:drug/metabolite transporter (DMT)-like permease